VGFAAKFPATRRGLWFVGIVGISFGHKPCTIFQDSHLPLTKWFDAIVVVVAVLDPTNCVNVAEVAAGVWTPKLQDCLGSRTEVGETTGKRLVRTTSVLEQLRYPY